MKADADPPIPFSIIVPTRGRATDFHRIAANFAPISKSWPVIVVANRASAPIEPALAERPNVRVMFAEGGGASRARNLGLLAAETDIVLFIDDDVLPSAASLELLASRAYSSDASVVTCRVLSEHSNAWTSIVKQQFFTLDRGDISRVFGQRGQRTLSPMMVWSLGVGAAFATNRARLKGAAEMPMFDESLSNGRFCGGAEDVDFFYQCLRAGLIIEYCASCRMVHQDLLSPAKLRAKMRQYALADGAFYAKWRKSLDAHDIGADLIAWADRVRTHAKRRVTGRLSLPLVALLLEPVEKVAGAAWWLCTG